MLFNQAELVHSEKKLSAKNEELWTSQAGNIFIPNEIDDIPSYLVTNREQLQFD